MPFRRTRARLAVLAGLMLAGCLIISGCSNAQTTTTDHPQPLALPQYHISLTIAAGWGVQQQENDPTANTPYTALIGLQHIASDASPSTFNLTIIKLSTPGIDQNITAIESDPSYQTTTIGGQKAYYKTNVYYLSAPTQAPDQTAIPSPPQTPGTAGTYAHTEYDIPTSLYLYDIATQSVAGQNADGGLNSMLQSVSIQP